MSLKKIIFITGTDTGVGKSLLTALLLHHLRESGCHALALKPFCSGGRDDVRLLQTFQRGELSDAEANPFYFPEPVAPLVELKKTGRNISLSKVIAHIQRIGKKCEQLLIEGSGGLMVPLGREYLVEDVISKLKCRTIIVARNQLGTINHTLLTVARLRALGIKNRSVTVALMCGPKTDASSAMNEEILGESLDPIRIVKIPNLGRSKWEIEVVKRGYQQAKPALDQLITTA